MRPSSYLTYRGYIDNHIKPYIGNISLSKLTTLDLQTLYKKLLTEGRVDRIEAKKQPKGLSAKTVRNIHQIISSDRTGQKPEAHSGLHVGMGRGLQKAARIGRCVKWLALKAACEAILTQF